jgi:hypothetical protein
MKLLCDEMLETSIREYRKGDTKSMLMNNPGLTLSPLVRLTFLMNNYDTNGWNIYNNDRANALMDIDGFLNSRLTGYKDRNMYVMYELQQFIKFVESDFKMKDKELYEFSIRKLNEVMPGLLLLIELGEI